MTYEKQLQDGKKPKDRKRLLMVQPDGIMPMNGARHGHAQ